MKVTGKHNYWLTDKSMMVVLLLFLGLLVWRLLLVLFPTPDADFNPWSFAWGASYQVVAIWGAIWGLFASAFWGGRKSVVGRLIIAFSLGLGLQSLGQSVYSFFIFTTGEAPYPSAGDIGFFGSIPLYIYGSFLLSRVSGVSVSLRSFSRQILAVMVPIALLLASFFLFLYGHEYDPSSPVTVLLDFGYPLGQAFYLAQVLLIFFLSRKYLGGIMRWPVLTILIALSAQYLADFTFLYQISRDLYIPEGINDVMYLVAYFLMAVALIRLKLTFKNLSVARE